VRIVVLQMWGLGNAVLTTPLLQALKQDGHAVDVVVERGRAAGLAFQDWPEVIDKLWVEHAPKDKKYDVGVFAHPVSGYAKRAVYKKRLSLRIPKNPEGYMWGFKKHEAEYIFDFASMLGFEGEMPGLRVPLPQARPQIPQPAVALGPGYLKTHPDWKKKHWGNEAYAKLAKRLYERGYSPIIVGGPGDKEDADEIEQMAPVALNVCGRLPFTQTVGLLMECEAFIGNDSGLMHVAAAVNLPTVGVFMMTNPVKNRPWCDCWRVCERPGVYDVLNVVEEILDGPDRSLHRQERDQQSPHRNPIGG
jgi:ADP-heptose:LPS heptosyltransferase